ncbi:helix-turn-helix domain-containing protein [Fictibacillus gelatini]|uniref:helix-turn-helix domain-containing protein n=1 Tax=Fictibacillus gelatini TaxID=225985 RepID=UPI00040622D5|nr:helix-turn-helix domain-containing protein [Fictibacillus gelatini]
MQWAYEEYREHQSFESIAELNEAVRQHLYYNAQQLNKTAVTVLKTISRYSCVVIGVSWLKAATLAKLIDKSEKTVRRALKTLEEIGAIKRIPTIRERGGRGYDICVIQACDQAKVSSRPVSESPSESKAEKDTDCKETLIHKTKITLDSSFTSDRVPNAFTHLVSTFWDNAKTIEEYWRMAKICAHKAFDDQTVLDVAINAFKQMIRTYKTGRVRNPFAYFYGVMDRKLDDKYYEEIESLGIEFKTGGTNEWFTVV